VRADCRRELPPIGAALIVAMETNPEPEPKVDVYEAPDGVLDVIIRTIDEDELEALRHSRRRPPKSTH